MVAIQDQMRDNYCWGCGADNDAGLHLKSEWDGERTTATWTPAPEYAAGPGTGAPRPSPGVVAVTDLQQFLAAVLQLPFSLTADLTLPEWHYFGSGSGNDGDFHRSPRAAATSPGLDTP